MVGIVEVGYRIEGVKMQQLADPILREFPLRFNGGAAKLAWVDEIAEALWYPIEDMLQPLLNSELIRYPRGQAPTSPGWHKYVDDQWIQVDLSHLGDCIVLDVESHQVGDQWVPTLAVATDGLSFFAWFPKDSNIFELIPIEQGTLIVGHNTSEHDSQFVSSEYLRPDEYKNGYIDTRSIADLCVGVSPDVYGAFVKFKAQVGKKKGVPEWARQCTETNLADLASHLLGIQVNKSVQGNLVNGVSAPENLLEYCCQDVLVTLQIFQRLYPMARNVNIKSNIFWHSRLEVTGLRCVADGWDYFSEWILAEYDRIKKIDPRSRTANQQKVVDWGKTYSGHIKTASIHNEILPCRFNPSNFTGAYKSDLFSLWVNGENFWDVDKWMEPSDIKYPLALGASNQPIADRLITFRVPPVNLESYYLDIQAKKHQSQALRVQVPGSCNTPELQKKWIRLASKAERMSIFITLMSAFIEEYELDAWLLIPGQEHCTYAINGAESAWFLLTSCANKSIKIASEIL